ncbi:MAG TPA: hypothetical protein DIU45_11235, partial [Clostridium sp.]|nr:hypothetical protein [Clostridium sp.]
AFYISVRATISTFPAIIGDSYYNEWKGKYKTDKWRRIIYEEVKFEPVVKSIVHKDETKEEVVQEGYTEKIAKLHEDYNPDEEYTPREQRKEFDAVGMLGKILVQDDGTCVVGGYCLSNDEGIATNAPTGYKVMERVEKDIVMISFHQSNWTQEQLRKLYNLIGTV